MFMTGVWHGLRDPDVSSWFSTEARTESVILFRLCEVVFSSIQSHCAAAQRARWARTGVDRLGKLNPWGGPASMSALGNGRGPACQHEAGAKEPKPKHDQSPFAQRGNRSGSRHGQRGCHHLFVGEPVIRDHDDLV